MGQRIDHDKIAAYLAGELPQVEEREVQDWIESSEENQRVFDNLAAALSRSDELGGLFDADEGWREMKLRIRSEEKSSGSPWVLRIAAAISFIVVSALAIYYFNSTPQQNLISATSEVIVKDLTDGSTVTLNRNSEIEILPRFGEETRSVSLNGEAYFDVVSETAPFQVQVRDVTVTVVGTEFNIAESSNEVVIDVYEGVVEVELDDASQKLIAGERVIISTQQRAQSDIMELDQNDIFWKTGDLFFESIPLEEAVQIISIKYGSSIVLDIDDPTSCLLTTAFEDMSLNDILEIITQTYGLEFTESQQVITLTGDGCD